MQTMPMTAEELLGEIQSGFIPDFMPPTAYLLSEYNMLLRSLYLLLPGSDASVTLTPTDGKLMCELACEQIRRVFAGERELLCASPALYAVLEGDGVYCPTEEGILVGADEDCTVYYRTLPTVLTEMTATQNIPLDLRYLPLVRAWLCHRAYLYLCDFDSADAFGSEYNRLLADYKAENGVVE